MVTADLDDLATEFNDIVEDRDVVSFASLGLAGAGGGVIATQVVNRVAPLIGLSPNPNTPRETFGVGLIKMLLGAGMAFLGTRVGGVPGVLLSIAGLGTIVLGGGDWVNAALTMGGSTTSSAPRARSTTSRSGNVSARPVGSSTTTAQKSNGTGASVSAEQPTANTDELEALLS